MKPNSSTAKRFKKTGTGKIMHRYASQDHFNTRENGQASRKKRRPYQVAKENFKTLKALLK
jgi:ribosomal protein L35